MNNVSKYAANVMQDFTANNQDSIDKQLLVYSENIAVMHQSSYDRMEARLANMEKKLQEQAELLERGFYQRFEQAMEVGIQDINDNIDDAMDKFNKHVDNVTTQFNKQNEHLMTRATKPADGKNTTTSRWNVDPAYRQQLQNMTPTQPPNTDQQPTIPLNHLKPNRILYRKKLQLHKPLRIIQIHGASTVQVSNLQCVQYHNPGIQDTKTSINIPTRMVCLLSKATTFLNVLNSHIQGEISCKPGIYN